MNSGFRDIRLRQNGADLSDTTLWKELSMPGESERTAHAWEIVQQLTQEQDRFRVAELAHKLNEAMLAEEREKVRPRLGITRSNAA
jgi:hypothetical protein